MTYESSSPDKASLEKAERQDVKDPNDLWEHPLIRQCLHGHAEELD